MGISAKKIIIQGITEQGKTFRPSDWAERISGALASFTGRRVHYSPLLQPSISSEGYHCILLDPRLQETSPLLYQTILTFAAENNLKICKEDEI